MDSITSCKPMASTRQSSILLLTSAFLSLQLRWSEALYETHTFSGADTWTYVTKFCFNPYVDENKAGVDPDNYRGVFEYDIYFPRDTNLTLYVYTSDKNDWDAAYKDFRAGCIKKGNIAMANGRAFPLHDHYKNERVYTTDPIFDDDPTTTRRVHSTLVFKGSRPQWFYFALGNCWGPLDDEGAMIPNSKDSNANEVIAKVHLTMLNGHSEDQHFSADEFGKLNLYTVYFIVFLLLVLGPIAYMAITLRKRKMLHHTVRILVASIVLETISVFFGFFYQVKYATTGFKYQWIELTAHLFHGAADVVLLVLMLVIAKGWTIVRRKISAQGRVKIASFMSVYGTTYFGLIMWHHLIKPDPATVTYFYDSPPGTILQWLRIISIGWFSYAIHTTRANYKERKGRFYCSFYVIGVCWLALLPFEVLLANTLAPWYRSVFIASVELSVTCLIFIGFIKLFWPSQFNRNFPFHTKTDAMNSAPTYETSNTGQSGINRFGIQTPNQSKGQTKPESPLVSSRKSLGGTGEFLTNHPAGFNRVPSVGDNHANLRVRRSVSGGAMSFGLPFDRIDQALSSMRGKLAMLSDVSDDIEYAVAELKDHTEEDGEDLPPDDLSANCFDEKDMGVGKSVNEPEQQLELPSVRVKKKTKKRNKSKSPRQKQPRAPALTAKTEDHA